MFHSAALKLTLWYLSIIMVLSLVCSGVIYHFSSQELARNTRRQVYFFNDQLSATDFLTFSRLRQKQLDETIDRLRLNLMLFNLTVLVSGGAASYLLARRTMRPIEEALESQTRFTGDASHELRTPLSAMQAEIEVALSDKSLTKSQAAKLLRSNLEETAKLRSLADGLLRLAATDSPQAGSQKVDLSKVIEQATARWDKIAAEKGIKIKTELTNTHVRGDHQSLVDLVSILIDNAVKYSPKGSPIKIKLHKKDRSAVVSVQDKGIGIEAKELPLIFERFYRHDSARTKEGAGGYGLGLAIAKKIAERSGGHIEVKSTPGRGSNFSLRLPLS